MFRRAAVLAALILVVPGVPHAQTPPEYRESIDVSLVNLDVIVTDKAGHRVHGLTKDDFEVYENRRRQPVTNFAEYREEVAQPETKADTPVQAPATPEKAAVPVQRRAIILFVERTRLPREIGRPFFDAIRSMLQTTMREGDLATLVTWDKGLMLVRHAATTDLAALEKTIDNLAFESESPLVNPYAAENAAGAQAAQAIADANEFYAAHGGGAAGSSYGKGDFEDMTVYAKRVQHDTEDKVAAIASLTRAFGQVDARKILIMATRLSPLVGIGPYGRAAQGQVGNAEAVKLAWMLDNALAKQRNIDLISASLRKITDAANANGVTVYPIVVDDIARSEDMIEGSGAKADHIEPPETAVQARSLLEPLARDTGGKMANGVSDATVSLAAVAEDLHSYYSLAYRATGASGARNIVVRTKRADLVVRSRTSWIVKSEEARMEDRVIGGLFGATGRAAFPIEVEVGKPAARRGTTIREVTVRFPIAGLTPMPDRDGYLFRYEVVIAGIGLRGVSEPFRETKSFHVPAAELEKAKRSHYTYVAEIRADAASRRVSVGVADSTSRDFGLLTFEIGQ